MTLLITVPPETTIEPLTLMLSLRSALEPTLKIVEEELEEFAAEIFPFTWLLLASTMVFPE